MVARTQTAGREKETVEGRLCEWQLCYFSKKKYFGIQNKKKMYKDLFHWVRGKDKHEHNVYS